MLGRVRARASTHRELQIELIKALAKYRQAGKTGPGAELQVWNGEAWVMAITQNLIYPTVTEDVLYRNPRFVTDAAFRTAWGATQMNEGMAALKDFLSSGNPHPPRRLRIVLPDESG